MCSGLSYHLDQRGKGVYDLAYTRRELNTTEAMLPGGVVALFSKILPYSVSDIRHE